MKLETKMGPKEWDIMSREMYPKTAIHAVNIFFLVCMVMAVRYYLNNSGGLMLYYILLGLIFEVITRVIRHNKLEAQRKFYEQEFGDKELSLLYDFGENSFQIENSITGMKTSYEYSMIYRYDTAKEYIFIRADHNQHFIIDKAEAAEKGLKEFLISKVPDMKVSKG